MSDTAWKEGALRSVGAGRERMGYNTNASILDHDRRRIKSDPDRFEAARLVRVMQRAGYGAIAADVAAAYGLRVPDQAPACRCVIGLRRVVDECMACRRYRMGWRS